MMTEVGPCKQAQSSCPLLLLQDFVSIINKVAGPNLAVQCNELFHLLLFVQQYFFLINTFSCYLQIPPAPFGTELLEQVGVTKVYHYKSDHCEVASCFSQISSSSVVGHQYTIVKWDLQLIIYVQVQRPSCLFWIRVFETCRRS